MKRLRPILILTGMAALALGAWDFSAYALETWQLAAITKRTESLKAAFEARDYRRPVLRGAPEPGNAWDCYLPALTALDAEDKFSNTYVQTLSDYTWGRTTADRSKVEEIFERHLYVLDLVRRGTRRAETRFPYDWSIDHFLPDVEFGDPGFRYDWRTDWNHRNPHLQHQAIYYLSRSRAKWLREMGRPMEAAELLLDFCVFERDRAHNDFWNTSGHVAGLQDELHDLLISQTLARPELGKVARELAILIEAEPEPSHLYLNSTLRLGMEFRKELRAGRQMRLFSDKAGLGELFSFKLLNARAFWLMNRWSEKLAQAASREWPEARAVQREIQDEIERKGERFERLTGVSTSSGSIQRLESAKLRLLRAGAHFLATGEVLELPDPFGSGSIKARGGDALRIWSVGQDGMDHQGRGTWRGMWNQDLVLEVSR